MPWLIREPNPSKATSLATIPTRHTGTKEESLQEHCQWFLIKTDEHWKTDSKGIDRLNEMKCTQYET